MKYIKLYFYLHRKLNKNEMEELEIKNEVVTSAVKHYIENRGVTKRWFYELLGITQPTFDSRLRGDSEWKKLEKVILQQHNIIK